MKTILNLALHREFFEAILSGKKTIEYRQRGLYWDKRLTSKPYSRVHFVNSYGSNRPCMDVEIKKIEKTKTQWKIHLGKISGKKNLSLLKGKVI